MPFAEEADLIIYYPGMGDSALDAIRPIVLEDSKCKFDEDIWGCNLKVGHIHMTAHMLTIWLQTQAVGVGGTTGGVTTGIVASKTMGPVSISYSNSSTGDSDDSLSTTHGGREYMRLRDCLGPQVAVPGGQGAACRAW